MESTDNLSSTKLNNPVEHRLYELNGESDPPRDPFCTAVFRSDVHVATKEWDNALAVHAHSLGRTDGRAVQRVLPRRSAGVKLKGMNSQGASVSLRRAQSEQRL